MTANCSCDCEVIHVETVEEVSRKMLPAEDYLELSELYRLFGDATRLRIMYALEKSELCVCDLASLLGMTKSAISHQLKVLRLSNLVKYRREGQNVFYSLADGHVKLMIETGLVHISEGKEK